jgi:hypothetical protein
MVFNRACKIQLLIAKPFTSLLRLQTWQPDPHSRATWDARAELGWTHLVGRKPLEQILWVSLMDPKVVHAEGKLILHVLEQFRTLPHLAYLCLHDGFLTFFLTSWLIGLVW